jgi:hypothetical protein
MFRDRVAAAADGCCWWGLTPAVQEFLATAPHASRWFLTLQHPTGPLSSQFFVNRGNEQTANLGYLKGIMEQSENTKMKAPLRNEVFITAAAPFNLYTAAANLLSVTTFEQLAAAPSLLKTTNIPAGYLHPATDIWCCATTVNDLPATLNVSGVPPTQLNKIIDPAGYELVFLKMTAAARVVNLSQTINGIGSPLRGHVNASRLTALITVTPKD